MADLLAAAKKVGNVPAVEAALAEAKSDLAEIAHIIGDIIRPAATAERVKAEADLERARVEATTERARLDVEEKARERAGNAQDEIDAIRATAKERMDKADPDVLAKTLHTNPTVESWMTPEEKRKVERLSAEVAENPAAEKRRLAKEERERRAQEAADQAMRRSVRAQEQLRRRKRIAQRSAGADFDLTATKPVTRAEQKAIDEKAASEQLAGQGPLFSRAPTLAPQWQGVVEGIQATDYLATDNGKPIGNVTIHERGGVPIILYHIEAITRRQGNGERILADVMRRVPEGSDLYIQNIQPDSVDFWRKMGVSFIDGNDATLTPGRFQEAQSARAGKAAAGVERAAGAGEARFAADSSDTPKVIPAGFVVDEENRETTQELAKFIKNTQGHEFNITPLGRLDEKSGAGEDGLLLRKRDASYALAERLARIFGKKVVWINADGPFKAGGITAPVGKLAQYIFLDPRSNNLPHVLVGHELTHHIAAEDPVTYRKLFIALNGLLRNYEQYRTKLPASMGEIEVKAEMIGDLMGDNFDKPEFWNLVAKESQGAFRAIANAVRAWLDRLVGIVTGKLGFGSEQFVTDIHKARLILAKALSDYEKAQKGGATGDSSPSFSREVIPTWAKSLPQAQQDALKKAGIITEEKTLGERAAELKSTFVKSFTQGMFDQFSPIKELDYNAYMLARMSKGSDGGLEAMMLYGRPYLDGGALNVGMEDGGLMGVFQGLQGEHDRFLAWIAGNRAQQLKADGKENLFTDDDISALKDLNQGKMPDGQNRDISYAAAHQKFNGYMNAVLDIAEQTGLIDGESRDVWAKDFYVPFYRAMEDGGGPTIKSGLVNQYAFKKLKGGQEGLKDLMANTLANWSHLLSASMKNQAAAASLQAAARIGVAREIPSQQKGAVSVLKAGNKVWHEVDDPLLLDAITAMEWGGFSGPAMEALGKFKRALTTGVTANPTFKIRNLIRDTVSSIAQGDLSYNAAKNLAQGWRLTAHSSPVRASMMAGGGLMRFGTMLEGNTAQHAKRLIEAGIDDAHVLDKPHKVKAMLQKMWDRYQELGDRGEQVNRAALYQQLRDRGLSHLEASYQARDLLDFSMQGKWAVVRFLTQVVPFMNARLQGMYKLGRAGSQDPARMAYVVGAASLASMALLLWNADDDDWKKREDWDRDQYWWFKVGDEAFRIPKPFEVGAVASVAERSLEYLISDERDPGKRFLKSMGNLVGNNLSMNPIPQLVKPLIDLYANKDSFTGRPIETEGMQHLSKDERIGRGTSLPAQILGLLDPTDSLSPVQIDFMARAYFGWLGTAAMTAVDYGIRPLSGLPDRAAMQLRDFPVLGNFTEGLPTNQSRYVTLFYDEAKKVDEAYADYRNALKLGQPEKAAEIIANRGELIRREREVAGARRVLGALNQQERRIELDQMLSPDAKRVVMDAIAAKKNELARRVTQ